MRSAAEGRSGVSMLQVVSVRYRYRSYVDPDVEQLQMEI
jgi:hypothetical protein